MFLTVPRSPNGHFKEVVRKRNSCSEFITVRIFEDSVSQTPIFPK